MSTAGGDDAGRGPRQEPARPEIRPLGLADLAYALSAGIGDLRRSAQYGLAFGLFYAAGGWLIIALLWLVDLPYLAYPMAMGFALVAPFVVTGLYDVSRRLEQGAPLSWDKVLGAVWDTRLRDLRWMALVTAFALVIWLDIAAALFFGMLGFRRLDAELVHEILTTPAGLMFLAAGNLAGAVIAFAVFSITVVSFPMLFDRDVDFVTAMVTSVKVVLASPLTMAVWCALIAVAVGVSVLTAFAGLLLVLPVLGHATWHLYRRAVTPASA